MEQLLENSSVLRSARRRKQAIPWLLLFLGAVCLFGVFEDGVIDKTVTAWFFDESSDVEPWPYTQTWWVQVCFEGVPLLVGAVGIAVLSVLIAGTRSKEYARWRGRMVGLLLLVMLGPGLIVNATLKDNWGRPRPLETVDFGGTALFQAPFVISDQGGKSFPCGHCSIPFALGAVAWWFRSRAVRASIFAVAISIGLITGMARVVIGAHYLSDVLASGWAVALAAWTLGSLWPSWLLLADRVDACREPVSSGRWLKGMAISVLVLAVLVGVMLGIPYDRHQSLELNPPSGWIAATTVGSHAEVSVRSSRMNEDQKLHLRLNRKGQLELKVRVRGFGFTWNEIRWSHQWILCEHGGLVLVLTPQIRGVFTEFRMSVS